MSMHASVGRVLGGVVFGFLLGIALHQAARVDMGISTFLKVQATPTDECKAVGANPTIVADPSDPFVPVGTTCPGDLVPAGTWCCPVGYYQGGGGCFRDDGTPCSNPIGVISPSGSDGVCGAGGCLPRSGLCCDTTTNPTAPVCKPRT